MNDEHPKTVARSEACRSGELPESRWSPWPASMVAAGKVSRSGLMVDGDSLYWSESRPRDEGRHVVVRSTDAHGLMDVSPPGISVRSRVHEYGGAAALVADRVLFYVDQEDQRWYRRDLGAQSAPVALTPASPAGAAWVRYADGRLSRSGQWLVCVEEHVTEDAVGHRIVAVAVGAGMSTDMGTGAGTGAVSPPIVLVDRGDFVAAPRISPDGGWLAWTTWDHPSMPWDDSEVWVARIEEHGAAIRLRGHRPVAGGDGSSVGQIQWCRDGGLLFVDDRSGWWQPYRIAPERLSSEGPTDKPVGGERLVDRAVEFHAPDWVLGQSTMVELSDGTIVCRMHETGRDVLVRLRPTGSGPSEHMPWSIETIAQPCVSISGVAAAPVSSIDLSTPPTSRPPSTAFDRVWILGSTPTEAHGVFEVLLDGAGPARRVSAGPDVEVSIAGVSVARPFTAATPTGPVPGLFFPPVRMSAPAPEADPPPLVVFCHGGPTSAAEAGFDPVVQFFAGRGLAVAIVDYRGSSGYGRAYRKRLDGLWGEADVDDCVAYATALEQAGLVDGDRMAIRGTSAGGLTALAALIRARRFAGATAWYGVTDLEALASDTHDFESRYVDTLVGPWPGAVEAYRSRSPIHHPEQVVGSVLLLQGADDPVVPPDQSQRFAAMLRDHHVPCQLTVFDGESHGFRRASTIEASLTAEIDFYRTLFDASTATRKTSPESSPRTQ